MHHHRLSEFLIGLLFGLGFGQRCEEQLLVLVAVGQRQPLCAEPIGGCRRLEGLTAVRDYERELNWRRTHQCVPRCLRWGSLPPHRQSTLVS